jgi:serine phosphatase RsbU (regulator of sigma subunit)
MHSLRDRLETILKNINQAFAEDVTQGRFATFVAVECEEGNDQLELLSAGHAPIFVYSSDSKAFRLIDAQALPLGILPDLWDWGATLTTFACLALTPARLLSGRVLAQ